MRLIHPELERRRAEQLAAVVLAVTLMIVLVAAMVHGVEALH